MELTHEREVNTILKKIDEERVWRERKMVKNPTKRKD
jgi:hypothetical protein